MDGSTRTEPRGAAPGTAEVVVPPHLDAEAEVVVPLRDADNGRVPGDLHRRLDAVLQLGPETVVIDVSEVTRFSSTTIAALLQAKRRCAARGVRVVLREPVGRAGSPLRRTGLLTTLAVETAGAAR
jgi:anti-anti-sigma factor